MTETLPSASPFAPFLDELADVSGRAIMPYFRSAMAVENKLAGSEAAGRDGGVPFDPVTVADRAAETALRALIELRHPGHGILGEEFGSVRLDAEHVWVLDPIDG